MGDMANLLDGLTAADFKFDYKDMLSQEQFDREIEFVFRRSWLVVGHDLEIPNPGDFLVRDLPT